MIPTLVRLLIAILILAMIWCIATAFKLPEPALKIVRLVLVVLFVIFLIYLLLPFAHGAHPLLR